MIGTLAIGNASATEIAWTLIGLVGVYYTGHNLRDARRYVVAGQRLNNRTAAERELDATLAFGHYRNELLRTAKTAVIVAVGVAAMLTPPAVTSMPVTPVQVIITLGIFALEILVVVGSALDRRQREILARLE